MTEPLVVIRDGPAGGRPGLRGGPDIWEVVRVHRSFSDVEMTAAWLDQSVDAISAALRHYEAHQEEIDAWIVRNDDAADVAERAARPRDYPA
jgi:hypothetical protein